MIYYHTTDAADEILRGGFQEATGSYGFAPLGLTGVFLGDSPMTINEAQQLIRFYGSKYPTMSTSATSN
jgi:hypothetical protein